MRNIKRIRPIINALLSKSTFKSYKQELKDLKKIWLQVSDQRLGQLVCNYGSAELNSLFSSYLNGRDLFFPEEYELLSAMHISPREYFVWGSRGVDGKGELTYKLLQDIDTDHIVNIIVHLKSQPENNSNHLKIFKEELEFRNWQKNKA